MRLPLIALLLLACCKSAPEPTNITSKLEKVTLSSASLASATSLRVLRAVSSYPVHPALYPEPFWILELKLPVPCKVELDADIMALVGEQKVTYASTDDSKTHYMLVTGATKHWVEVPFGDPGFNLVRAALSITTPDNTTHTIKWP